MTTIRPCCQSFFTGIVNGKQIKLVAAGDKAGNFWILDAENGELISKTPVSYQYNQDSQPQVDGANYLLSKLERRGRIQRRSLRSGD
jgi:glucose dehydrogenase